MGSLWLKTMQRKARKSIEQDGLKLCVQCEQWKPADNRHFAKARGKLRAMCKECVARHYGGTTGEYRPRKPRPETPCREGEKWCSHCETCKPVDQFHTHNYHRDGLVSMCKSCSSERHREYYLQTQDAAKARAAKWRTENRERYLALLKLHWERKDKELERQRLKQYRKNNPDKRRASCRKYRDENQDKVKAKNKEYKRNNPHKAVQYQHKRESRKLALPSTFSDIEWFACKEFFAEQCACCGASQKLTMDHWIPLSSSDCPGHVANNIVPMCLSCNTSKFNRNAEAWLTWKFGEERAKEILARIQAYFDTL